MKYNAGDCLSFNVGKNSFLAGFLSSVERGQYELSLTDYHSSIPPTEDHFKECLVFSIKYEMGETSFSALDIVCLDPKLVDNIQEIDRICHIGLPGFLAAAEFKQIAYSPDVLLEYFNIGLAIRNGITLNIDPLAISVGTKCLIPLAEFISNIPPVNNFPALKLYIEKQGELYYWQIYGSSNEPVSLVIHWGKVGETGQFKETLDKSVDEITKIYEAEIAAKRSEGFSEREDGSQMILQFQSSDAWGNTDDLDFRNEISDYLDKYLFWTGNGSTTGGDIGSGTVNIFLETVVPEIAVKTIVQALADKKVELRFLIALENYPTANELSDGEGAVKVLYPADFSGEFFY
jgi:predicted DNA-binding WGR domain protein